MIKTIEEARSWYEAVAKLAWVMERIGRSHWDRPEWHDALARDARLRDLESSEIQSLADTVRSDLDDLAVLVLFSVFEATVRERAILDVERELSSLRHPALVDAGRQLRETLASGSFFRVTEAYKGLDPELTSQVNQVRRFRNWVAHGRREDRENQITPKAAFARLGEFLERMALESESLQEEMTPGPGTDAV